MAMTSINVSLSDSLGNYVENQLASGEYGTPSDYVRDLIRQDQERRALRLEAELLDALASPRFTIDPAAGDGSSFMEELRLGLENFSR